MHTVALVLINRTLPYRATLLAALSHLLTGCIQEPHTKAQEATIPSFVLPQAEIMRWLLYEVGLDVNQTCQVR